MKLTAEHGQHVHAGHGLALQQHRDVVAVDLNADGFLLCDRGGLMRRLLQHRRETEELALRRLIHDDFLVIFVHRCDPDRARDHHVRLPPGSPIL